MSELKFYMDTHISKQVTLQLRQHGVDAIRCEEVGLSEADDETHLQYAADNERILVTKDRGFRDRHFRWMGENRDHYGIFLFKGGHEAFIGQIVNFCRENAELVAGGAGTPDDFRNSFIDAEEA